MTEKGWKRQEDWIREVPVSRYGKKKEKGGRRGALPQYWGLTTIGRENQEKRACPVREGPSRWVGVDWVEKTNSYTTGFLEYPR